MTKIVTMWPANWPHEQPEQPLTVGEAHQTMQHHRACLREECDRKQAAWEILVQAGRVRPRTVTVITGPSPRQRPTTLHPKRTPGQHLPPGPLHHRSGTTPTTSNFSNVSRAHCAPPTSLKAITSNDVHLDRRPGTHRPPTPALRHHRMHAQEVGDSRSCLFRKPCHETESTNAMNPKPQAVRIAIDGTVDIVGDDGWPYIPDNDNDNDNDGDAEEPNTGNDPNPFDK